MRKILLFATVVIFTSCGFNAGEELTEQQVKNYIKTYKTIRADFPQMIEKMEDPSGADQANMELFQEFTKVLKSGGFENFQEFVLVNGKIAAIFSVLQAEKGMADQKNLNTDSKKMLTDGMKQIQDILNDPEIPEEVKAEQRKLLEELQAGEKELTETWEDNAQIATEVIDGVKKVSGFLVTENDLKLVKKYENEIMAVYIGQ